MVSTKSLRRGLGLLLLFWVALTSVFAQKDSVKTRHPAVQLKARAQKDRILLRWAVDQPGAWHRANQYGFHIERFTVMRDGKTLSKIPRTVLTPQPIRPKGQQEWLQVMETNDRAAILAQCLFGESPDVSTPKDPLKTMLDKAELLNQRFSFALMAADQSFEAALLAGWGYVDTDVKPNERYFYTVKTTMPASVLPVTGGKEYVGLPDYTELPALPEIQVEFGDKVTQLQWYTRSLTAFYNAYWIERSEDSLQFKRITNTPIGNLNNGPVASASYVTYSDTLETNDQKYYYRVRGTTCFDEISAPSATVVGMGQGKMVYTPYLTGSTMLNDSTAVLEWELMPDSSNVLLDHFELSRAETADGSKAQLLETQLDKRLRKHTVHQLTASNYFIVAAVDKYGKRYPSFPFMVQPVDSIPPAVPEGLEGTVSDSGVVSIRWKANTESDIHGYHIYKGNVKDEEFSLITAEPIPTAQFQDSTNLEMLNPKVYYKIAALDKRFNQSKPSQVLVLTKPDKIPPITPQFRDFKLSENGVELFWDNSASEDVALHRLYKLDPTDRNALGKWVLLKEFKGSDTTQFIDTQVKGGLKIAYTLVAVDRTRNESPPSVPVTVTVPLDKRNKPPVKDLRALVDRKAQKVVIDWLYAESGIVEFQVYRSLGSAPITLWKVIQHDAKGIIDDDVSINNLYRYAVRAVFSDGTMSSLKEVKINF
jgi:uncharacterized protein